MKTEYINCEVCGSENCKVVWDKKYDTDSPSIRESGIIINGINVVCVNCGLVYLNPRMTEDESTEFYKREYRKLFKPDLVGERVHAELAHDYLLESVDGIKPYFKALDVGCSYGIMVQALVNLGFDASGIDTNNEAVEIGRQTGVRLTCSSIENFTESGFKLITLINTLEHTYSPTSVLKKMRSLLTDDGLILIVVPDLYTNILVCTMDGFFSTAHNYTFDVLSLKSLVQKCGFLVKKISISHEKNFGKIYLLAQKTDKELKVNFCSVDPNMIRQRLAAQDFVIRASLKRYGGLKRE